MSRSRNIKPGFYKNEDLAECSIWARYIFPGLWMLADREGRLEDRPKRIKGELLPFDSVEVEPLLDELKARGFILRYEVEGQRFIQILAFAKHQNPHHREPPSIIPPPQSPGLRVVGKAVKPEAIGSSHDRPAQGQPRAEDASDSSKAQGEPRESLGPAPGQPQARPPSEGGSAVLIPDSGFLIPENPPLPPLAGAKGGNGQNGHDHRKRRRKPLTDCPEEFALNDAMYDWANAKGISDDDVMLETEACLNHHKAKGNERADWNATWRTWMLNVVKFRKEREKRSAP